MTTVGKVAIGAAVVIGGIAFYKIVIERPAPVRTAPAGAPTPATLVNSFISAATAASNYFTRNPPSPLALPTSKWDSTSDVLLPLGPGESAYADDTSHDYLLS